MPRWTFAFMSLLFTVMIHESRLFLIPAMISISIAMLLFWKRRQIERGIEKLRIMSLIKESGGVITMSELHVKDETILQELEACGLLTRRYFG
jgi:hypothetical protein